MEKEMLVHLKIKEGKLETFMGWMQSDEGMGVRKSVAYPEKTIGAMIPDKSGMLFKVNVHNEAGMKEFVTGNNPTAKAIYAECVDSAQLYELSKINRVNKVWNLKFQNGQVIKSKNLIVSIPFPQCKKLLSKFMKTSLFKNKVIMNSSLTVLLMTNKKLI